MKNRVRERRVEMIYYLVAEEDTAVIRTADTRALVLRGIAITSQIHQVVVSLHALHEVVPHLLTFHIAVNLV